MILSRSYYKSSSHFQKLWNLLEYEEKVDKCDTKKNVIAKIINNFSSPNIFRSRSALLHIAILNATKSFAKLNRDQRDINPLRYFNISKC